MNERKNIVRQSLSLVVCALFFFYSALAKDNPAVANGLHIEI